MVTFAWHIISFTAGMVVMYWIERVLDDSDRPEAPEHLKGTLAELYGETDAKEGLTKKGDI